MPSPVIPLTVAAPGFLGLNTQAAGSVLPPGWATEMSNFVFDEVGRIVARNGSKKQHATAISSSPTIEAIHEYIDKSGNKVNILAADNKIFKEVTGTVTDISGTITTPTDNQWQFVNFNGWCVGFQVGHAPIVATSATTPTFADSGGTQFNGSMGLSAYGRLWTVLGNTLYHSDLLINNFTGGSSGTFDLSLYWPNGMDEAVALVDFSGFLVVFGKDSIIVYENADDITNMAIVEGVSGVGCVYRDSVQTVGKEVVFMSSTGLRGLGRTLQAGYMPLSDYSKNIIDDLLADIASEDPVSVKSVYNRDEGFYVLSLPLAGKSYVFDVRLPQQDGSWRVTTWDIAPTAFDYTQALDMHMAIDAGFLSVYTGWKDGVASDSTGGTAYTIDFEGVWNDFGEEVAVLLKILKSVSVLGTGTAGSSVIFKWAVDYSTTFTTRALTFNTIVPSQYGVAQYDIDVYAAQGDFERVKTPLARAGQVIKFGVTTSINGNLFALQRIDVLAKVGRIGL